MIDIVKVWSQSIGSICKVKSSGVTSVQFVRDYLFDLAKYLLAVDSGDDLRQMDYSDVWIDVVV